MIALDALRSALVSPQPWDGLDRLVRAELSRGRLTKQIREELIRMEEQARDTPGFNDDAEEALHDTIDALAGICPAQYAYENPPVLPTQEEIEGLPRWARVAFAARCASRVLPLFTQLIPNPNQDDVSTLQNCLFRTIQATRKSHPFGSAWDSATDVMARADVLDAGKVANAIGLAEYSSRCYEYDALRIGLDEADKESIRAATKAAEFAEQSAASFGSIASAARKDFDHLVIQNELNKWTDNSPVPPEIFGPMWVEGYPRNWPTSVEHSRSTGLCYEVAKQQEVDDGELIRETLNIFNALNEYHISRGGQPLTLSDLQLYLPALVPAGV